MKPSTPVGYFYWLADYVSHIEVEMAKLKPAEDLEIGQAVAEALTNGGKRVRAVLTLLWCEVFSGDYKRALPMAAAYELAHATALIQDDIIDNSAKRRGRSSTIAKYGLLNAILASDMLLFNVPKKMAEYVDLDSRRLCKLFDLVGEACRATTMGEFLDLRLAARDDATEEDYNEMIRLKTASLLGAPAASGAILGGASENEANKAYRFGELVGIAYQIQDDLLDMMGDEEVLGKPVFTDVRGGKKNLLTIHAMRNCTEPQRAFMGSLFGKSTLSEREVGMARELLVSSGAVSYARARAAGYTAQAKELLTEVGAGKARDQLAELTDYLSQRYY